MEVLYVKYKFRTVLNAVWWEISICFLHPQWQNRYLSFLDLCVIAIFISCSFLHSKTRGTFKRLLYKWYSPESVVWGCLRRWEVSREKEKQRKAEGGVMETGDQAGPPSSPLSRERGYVLITTSVTILQSLLFIFQALIQIKRPSFHLVNPGSSCQHGVVPLYQYKDSIQCSCNKEERNGRFTEDFRARFQVTGPLSRMQSTWSSPNFKAVWET